MSETDSFHLACRISFNLYPRFVAEVEISSGSTDSLYRLWRSWHSSSHVGMYDFRKPRWMHLFATAFIKRVKILYAILKFSLQGIRRSSAAFSSFLLKSS